MQPNDEEKTQTEEATEETTTSPTQQQDKVVILFKAVGNAPILKKSKAKINSTSQFREVIGYIRKLLKLKSDQSLVSNIHMKD
jgi:ubiquitin-like protein ATG12